MVILNVRCTFMPLLLGASMIFVGACQDYEFVEVPTEVIQAKSWETTISIATAADILFVVDNSGSMAGEQKQLALSFVKFTDELNKFFGDNYHIGVITTGMESHGCPRCSGDLTDACINETGENGRFQDRRGKLTGTEDTPVYTWDPSDPNCRVITGKNKSCFYDSATEKGVVFVGTNSCGYERGLEPIRVALGDLAGSYNAGFLRSEATLVVVVVSDEEDCGNVGDVTEKDPSEGGVGAAICYYAAKGVDPDNKTVDPDGKTYELTPVDDYYQFLLDVKDGNVGMVKFAAIVGVKDKDNPTTTTIEYEYDEARKRYDAAGVCSTPNCPLPPDKAEEYCKARPGTRYIDLARKFGQNGFIDTICQDSFADTMTALGTWVACPEQFILTEPILDRALANILIDNEELPPFSCNQKGALIPCANEQDNSCPGGAECVRTWIYCSPNVSEPDRHPRCPPSNPPGAQGGVIMFGEHYDPCDLIKQGQIQIKLVYITG